METRLTTVVASILGLALLLDIAATVMLVRSTYPTRIQKILQIVFIWAIPFIGSIVVIAVLRETVANPRSRPGSGAGDVWLPGIGPGSESSGGHHSHHGGGGDVGHGGDGGGH